jgi:ABC-2 type transport system ATP-binding protein/lipopolysaccharide transport system ATP-binding protein
MTLPTASNPPFDKFSNRSYDLSRSHAAPIIQLENISVRYRVPQERIPTFKEYVIRWLRGQVRYNSFWALQDINLEIKPGEVFGIIGPNGAGKSTLLKVIARVLYPTRGRLRITGRVAPLLELGAGFDAEMTGRENIYLNGAILGNTREEINALFPEIVEFSGLQDFIEAPLRTYSTGMIARLGFSVATASRPEILIVDEILGVGDAEFQTKSFERIQSFQAAGTTILLVSHSLEKVEEFCGRAIWLEHGKIISQGSATAVISQYVRSTMEKESDRITAERQAVAEAHRIARDTGSQTSPQISPTSENSELTQAINMTVDGVQPSGLAGATASSSPPVTPPEEERAQAQQVISAAPPTRWGSQAIEITGVHIYGSVDSNIEQGIFETGQPFVLQMDYLAHKPVSGAIFGMAIHRQDGLHMTGPNTSHTGLKLPELVGSGSIIYQVDHLPLLEGLYHVSVAVVDDDDSEIFDYHDRLYSFRVVNVRYSDETPDVERYGLLTMGGKWRLLES